MQIFQLPVLGSRQLRHRASDGPGPGPASGYETPQEPPKRGQQRLLLSEPGLPGRGGCLPKAASAPTAAGAGAGAGPRPGGSHRRHLGGGGKMEEEEGRRRQKALLESRIPVGRLAPCMGEEPEVFSMRGRRGRGVSRELCVLQKTKALVLHIAVIRKRMLYQIWLKSLSWVCGNSSQAHGKLLETHFHASAWLGFPGKGHLEAASWNSLRGRTVGLSSKLKVQPFRSRLYGLRSRRFHASHLRTST